METAKKTEEFGNYCIIETPQTLLFQPIASRLMQIIDRRMHTDDLTYSLNFTYKGFNDGEIVRANYDRNENKINIDLNLHYFFMWIFGVSQNESTGENKYGKLASKFENEYTILEMDPELIPRYYKLLSDFLENNAFSEDFITKVQISIIHERYRKYFYERYSYLLDSYEYTDTHEEEILTYVNSAILQLPIYAQSVERLLKSSTVRSRKELVELQAKFKEILVESFVDEQAKFHYLRRSISLGFIELMIKVCESIYEFRKLKQTNSRYSLDIETFVKPESMIILPDAHIFKTVEKYMRDQDFNGAFIFLENMMERNLRIFDR